MFEWSSENEWSQSPNNGGFVSHDNAVPSEIGNECFLLANFFEDKVGNDATSGKNDAHTCNVESDLFSYLSTMEDPFSSGLGSSFWHNFFPLDASSTSAEFIDAGVHLLDKDIREYQWDNINNFDGFDSVFRNKIKDPMKSLIITGDSSTSSENLLNSTEFFQQQKELMNHVDIPFFTLHSTNQVHKGIMHKKNKSESATLSDDQHPLEYRGEDGFCRNLLPFACLEQQHHLTDSESSDIHREGSNSCSSFLNFQNTKDDPMCTRMQASDRHQNSEHENPAYVNHLPAITTTGNVENYSRSIITESSHQILPHPMEYCQSGGEYCDPEGTVSQLQKVVAKMDTNSRLLVRDCLFRLGRNAKRRRDTSTDATSSVRCVRLKENDERDTNSVDRLMVHFLFKVPAPQYG